MFDVTFEPGEQIGAVHKCNVVSQSGEVIAMYYGNNDNHAMVRAKMDFLNYEPIIGYSSLRHDVGDIVHKLNIRMLRKFNVENIDVRFEYCPLSGKKLDWNQIEELTSQVKALYYNEWKNMVMRGSRDYSYTPKLTT